MRNKRWMIGGGALLSVAAAVLIVPVSRQVVFGTLRGEPTYNGKFMSQWVDKLADADDDTRREATNNLGNLGASARSALPDLVRVMREDQDDRIRCMASFAIYKISSEISKQGGRATEALDGLIAALQDPHPLVRMNATLALGALGADAGKALPELQAGIKNMDNDVRVLWFIMTVREQMIITLGMIGPEARDALGLLEELLRDDRESARSEAARTLGKLGAEAKHAVPHLIAAIEDEAESEKVQRSAREALELIDSEAAAKLSKK